MKGCLKGVRIEGITTVVPRNKVDNLDYIDKIENRRIKKQVLLTGIHHRHVCVEGQTATDLVIIAANRLLDKLGWRRDEVKVLVYVTQSPELSRPSTAFLIQKELGIGQNCLVFDINLGCSGFVGGLETVASLLSVNGGKGLLLVGESHAMEGGDINTSSLLVGDAGSATALVAEGDDAIQYSHYSDGSRAGLIYRPFQKPGFMDGNAVLLFGLNDVVNSIGLFLEENHISRDEIDAYVFHQAQKMILDGIAQGAKLPAERVLNSCDEYGNTSSASIPLTLSYRMNREIADGVKKVLLCGFGIGLSWGICCLNLDTNLIEPIEESDEIVVDRTWFQR